MSAICLAAAGALTRLAVTGFTLAWMHSVEHVLWEEDWAVQGDRLVIVQSRVRGSGAGMEPPEGATFHDGSWHYRPALPPLPELDLTWSDFTQDWRLCAAGTCRPLHELVAPPAEGGVIRVYPCP